MALIKVKLCSNYENYSHHVVFVITTCDHVMSCELPNVVPMSRVTEPRWTFLLVMFQCRHLPDHWLLTCVLHSMSRTVPASSFFAPRWFYIYGIWALLIGSFRARMSPIINAIKIQPGHILNSHESGEHCYWLTPPKASVLSGVKKMTAKAAKTVKYGASVDGISTAEPDQYAKRFLAFMGDAIEWSLTWYIRWPVLALEKPKPSYFSNFIQCF